MKYYDLLIMTALSFVSMFALMYIMVDSYSNIYINLNQLYMAGVMTAPMVLIELLFMRSMYSNKNLNFILIACACVTFMLLVLFIRRQTGINDKEFLKSMIPHHAAAILMCKQAHLQNSRIQKICDEIIVNQQSEINLMKEILQTL